MTVIVLYVDGSTEEFHSTKYVTVEEGWLRISDSSGSDKWFIPNIQIRRVEKTNE